MLWLPLNILPYRSPHTTRLKPLDVQFMKAIHNKVNVVPVIAKADTLTLRERERLKRRVTQTRPPDTLRKSNMDSKVATYEPEVLL